MVGVPGTGVLGPAVFCALRALEGRLEVIPGPRGTDVDVVTTYRRLRSVHHHHPFNSTKNSSPPLP
jgi:hypothetical protein